MKPHRGMRPYDIAILLAISIQPDRNWRMREISRQLHISASEVSESLNRSRIAGLISEDKRKLSKLDMLVFLENGLRYVFPANPGEMVMGMPTAHSHIKWYTRIHDKHKYVWPHPSGKVKGLAIAPLHPRLPEACLENEKFYELMALCDSLRVGDSSERQQAINELRYRL